MTIVASPSRSFERLGSEAVVATYALFVIVPASCGALTTILTVTVPPLGMPPSVYGMCPRPRHPNCPSWRPLDKADDTADNQTPSR
jgi:hypothetical protein